MTYKFFPILVFIFSTFSSNKIETPSKFPSSLISKNENFSTEIIDVYNHLNHNNFALPKLESFKKQCWDFMK